MPAPGVADDSLTALFSAALALSAILFGVFGFLYTLYAMHLSQLTGAGIAPILPRLRTICRLLSILTLSSVVVAGAAAYGMRASGLALVLGWVLVGITVVAAGVTLYLAFRTMGEGA